MRFFQPYIYMHAIYLCLYAYMYAIGASGIRLVDGPLLLVLRAAELSVLAVDLSGNTSLVPNSIIMGIETDPGYKYTLDRDACYAYKAGRTVPILGLSRGIKGAGTGVGVAEERIWLPLDVARLEDNTPTSSDIYWMSRSSQTSDGQRFAMKYKDGEMVPFSPVVSAVE